jgi:hypothetical protein
MKEDAFASRRIGITGHEILGPDGRVIAWTVDADWAALIVALLNRVETDGLSGQDSPEVFPTGT